MPGPTRVVVPTRDFANGVLQLEASESLEAVPARVDPPDVRFRLSESSSKHHLFQDSLLRRTCAWMTRWVGRRSIPNPVKLEKRVWN